VTVHLALVDLPITTWLTAAREPRRSAPHVPTLHHMPPQGQALTHEEQSEASFQHWYKWPAAGSAGSASPGNKREADAEVSVRCRQCIPGEGQRNRRQVHCPSFSRAVQAVHLQAAQQDPRGAEVDAAPCAPGPSPEPNAEPTLRPTDSPRSHATRSATLQTDQQPAGKRWVVGRCTGRASNTEPTECGGPVD